MLIVRLPLCGAGNHLAATRRLRSHHGGSIDTIALAELRDLHVTPLGVPAMSPGNEATKCTSSSRTRRRSTDRLLSAGGARPLVVSEERAEASSGSWAGPGGHRGTRGASALPTSPFRGTTPDLATAIRGRRQIGSGGWADRGRHSNNGSAFWKGRPAGCRRLTTAPRVNEERNTPHMRFRMLP